MGRTKTTPASTMAVHSRIQVLVGNRTDPEGVEHCRAWAGRNMVQREEEVDTILARTLMGTRRQVLVHCVLPRVLEYRRTHAGRKLAQRGE